MPLTGKNVRPGEKPPEYPDDIAHSGQDSANSFVAFFVKALDWGYATTNPSYMKHYYGPTCGLCEGFADDIEYTRKDHHFYLGGRLTAHDVTETAIAPVTAPADFCTLLLLDVTSGTAVDDTGKIFHGDPAGQNVPLKICTTYRRGHWKVTFLSKVVT